MDEVLTRPLFRDAYLQTVKKKTDDGILSVYKFQKGGEVFTEAEKQALFALPFIKALTGATTRSGESNVASLIRSLGQGAGDVAPLLIDMKKIEVAGRPKKESVPTLLSAGQVNQLFPDIKVEPGGVYQYSVDKGLSTVKQSGLKDLTESINKAKIPDLESSLTDIEDKWSKYIDKDGKLGNIPGIGRLGYLNPSDEARENRQISAKLNNIIAKERFGSSQTNRELDSLKLERAQGKLDTQEQQLKALVRIRNAQNASIANITAGYNDEEIKAWQQRSGLGQKESPFSFLITQSKPRVSYGGGLPSYKVDLSKERLDLVK